MTLALVVFNIVFIIAVYMGSRETRQNLDKVIQTLLVQNDKAMQMLYNCLPNKEK